MTIVKTLAFGVAIGVVTARFNFLLEKRRLLRISAPLISFVASVVTIGAGALAVYESHTIRNFFSMDETPAQETAIVETIEQETPVRENSFSVTETTSSSSEHVRQALRNTAIQVLRDKSFDVVSGDSPTRFSIDINSQYSSEHRDRFNTYVTRCGATLQLTDQIQKLLIDEAQVAEEGIGGHSVSDNESRCYDVLARKLLRALQADIDGI